MRLCGLRDFCGDPVTFVREGEEPTMSTIPCANCGTGTDAGRPCPNPDCAPPSCPDCGRTPWHERVVRCPDCGWTAEQRGAA